MRVVFVGTGAFLGRVDGETRCAFWAADPSEHGFDPTRLISIDLALTPNAAIAGRISWDAIQVDDCYTGANGNEAGTTLGPRWPEIQTMGLVYLETSFAAQLPPTSLPADAHARPYERTTVLYRPQIADPRAANRYAGHHAEILEERGSVARVVVYPPGSSLKPGAKSHKLWIDLADPEQCDAGVDQLTQIGPGAMPKQGALFLIAGRIADDTEL